MRRAMFLHRISPVPCLVGLFKRMQDAEDAPCTLKNVFMRRIEWDCALLCVGLCDALCVALRCFV